MPLNCEICLGSIKKNIIKIKRDKKKKFTYVKIVIMSLLNFHKTNF